MQDFAVGMGHPEQLHRAERPFVEGDAVRRPIDIIQMWGTIAFR
jgi:hypothetical protein